jgi:hypothetical protein
VTISSSCVSLVSGNPKYLIPAIPVIAVYSFIILGPFSYRHKKS